MQKDYKTVVVLANLGAPSNLEEVRPFLKNLFGDPDIFHFPFGRIGQDIFSSMIAALRAPKSRRSYGAIGGGSPLHANTLAQAKKLQTSLDDVGDYKVFVAQRYWKPFIADVVQKVEAEHADRIIVVPLYPHYSTTSTLSIITEWKRHWTDDQTTQFVERFYDSPIYIKACVEQLEKKLNLFSAPPHILFSAHSIPMRRIAEGDPYQQELEHNMELIMEALNGDYGYSLCYQSRVGPIKWLGPKVETVMDSLVKKQIKNILIFPISFVSEHLETLYELDIQKKNYALTQGVESYVRAETVQDSDLFISALKELILKQ